jgi:Uma2 family endonuclease
MATTDTLTTSPKPAGASALPDTPTREPDEMTSYDLLHSLGNSHHIIRHLGNEKTTLVFTDKFIALVPYSGPADLRRNPDLAIAFNANRDAFLRSNGYIISEQGKPPDFVLEIASRSTARIDVGQKREDYELMGIPEYWRFDETGEFHGARLAGDRLVEGRYELIPIVELSDGSLEGYIAVLDLNIRWEDGELGWYDPATGLHIATFDSERARADDESAARQAAEDRADSERAARQAAEDRVRELEAQIRRLQDS